MPAHQSVETRFHALIHEGCYLCLRDVVREYAALPMQAREVSDVKVAAVHAALLFQLRRRELGMPQDDDAVIAEQLVEQGLESSDPLRQMVQAMPWEGDGVGYDFIERENHRWPSPTERVQWSTSLQWDRDEASAYVYVRFVCQFNPAVGATVDGVREKFQASPLVQYGWAACKGDSMQLEQLLKAHPRFVEIEYAQARDHAANKRWAEAADGYLRAWTSLPNFTAAGLAAARALQRLGDDQAALELAEAVLKVVPGHRAALLIKVEALSSLARYQAASDIARHLVELGRWRLGDAFYWLGWNEYFLREPTSALAHVTEAKDYERSARTSMLAGTLEAEASRWISAEREFAAAVEMDPTVCEAHVSLAHAKAQLLKSAESNAAYVKAENCLVALRTDLETQAAELEAKAQANTHAARQLAVLRGRLDRATTLLSQIRGRSSSHLGE